jgi:hypothetical protein
MRITSGGNVGIGTSSPSSFNGSANQLVVGTTSGNNGITIAAATTGFSSIYFADGTTGNEAFRGYFEYGHSADYLALGTAASERMRITSGGFLKASNNGAYANAAGSYHELKSNVSITAALIVTNTNATPAGQDIYFTASPNNTSQAFFYCQDGTEGKFVVWSNGDVDSRTNSYGGWSDVKLKENIVDATPKLDDLLKVKVKNYNFIGDDKKQIGVVAQELEEIFPNLINESPDFENQEVTDEEGNVTTERVDLGTTTKSVKYSVFVPMLIKAMQELKEIVDNQQQQINDLKAQLNG